MVKSMMSEAGLERYHTNHSLRAAAVTGLFLKNVHDKLIKGETGDRSEALQTYKRETEAQMVEMSKIVQAQAGRGRDYKEEEENVSVAL